MQPCVCVGEFPALSGPGQAGADLVNDVAELIWSSSQTDASTGFPPARRSGRQPLPPSPSNRVTGAAQARSATEACIVGTTAMLPVREVMKLHTISTRSPHALHRMNPM
jgi:hypothetical protein